MTYNSWQIFVNTIWRNKLSKPNGQKKYFLKILPICLLFVFLLIRHSKYSAILSKYALTDCFFGDFAHWVVICKEYNIGVSFLYRLECCSTHSKPGTSQLDYQVANEADDRPPSYEAAVTRKEAEWKQLVGRELKYTKIVPVWSLTIGVIPPS